ncbi:MAG: hypothetical protein KDA86_14340 [Planctomycetaceae bacterium]|nr:hypothetical protein [Planctomycetaceae bacterium]MCA9109551.1 hypothetical protein [Planctomycetaceae bacterium]
MRALIIRLVRPCVIGFGLALMMTGSTLLFVDRVTLRNATEMQQARMPQVFIRVSPLTKREFSPPQWMPITLLAAGGLTVLYSIALPRKFLEA